MKNIITKSIIYILFSFFLFGITLFFINNNNTFSNIYLSFKYSIYELFGLILFISQFMLICREKITTSRDLLVNSIFCFIIYFISKEIIVDNDILFIKHNNLDYLFIDREQFDIQKFNIFSVNFVNKFIMLVHSWDLENNNPQSAFLIFLSNISINYYFKEKFYNQIIFRSIILIIYFFFLLIIWKPIFNIPLFLISLTIILNLKGDNNEIY